MPLFDAEPKGLEGINAFYDREIVPALTGLEAMRRDALKAGYRVLLNVTVIVLAAAVATMSVAGYVSHPASLLLYGAIMVAALLSNTAFANFREVRHEYKRRVVGKLAGFIGLHYWPEGHEEVAETLIGLALLPSHDFHYCEDGFSGMENGLRFRLTEVALKKRGGSINDTHRTVFHGVLLTINLNKTFQSRTVAVRSRDIFAAFLKDGSWPKQRIKLEDPRFESWFDVYSDDAVESRFLLAPLTMERIMALAKGRWGLVAGFADGQLHVAYRRKDSFEAGEVMEKMSNPETTRGIVRDLMAIRHLVGAVASAAEVRT